MKKTVRFIGWERRHENSLSLGAVSSQWQQTSGCFQLAYISADLVSLLPGKRLVQTTVTWIQASQVEHKCAQWDGITAESETPLASQPSQRQSLWNAG